MSNIIIDFLKNGKGELIFDIKKMNNLNEKIWIDLNDDKKLIMLAVNTFKNHTKNSKINNTIIDFFHDENEAINISLKKYFDFKILSDNNIINSDFYNFWEMYLIFDCINEQNMEYFIYENNNISILQSLIFFYSKKYSDSKINKNVYNVCCENKIKKNEKIVIENITKKNMFDNNKKYDFIIINDDENNKIEFEEKIKFVSNKMKIKGNCIIKIFNPYNLFSYYLINLIEKQFKKMYIYKPIFKNFLNDEFYLICLDYDGEKKLNFENKYVNVDYKQISYFLIKINTEQYNLLNMMNLFYENKTKNNFDLLNFKNNILNYWTSNFLPLNKNDFEYQTNKFTML